MDAKMNKKQDIVKLAKAGNEPAEFALGKKGILICPEDDSYYFKKSWHNGRRAFLNRRENHDLSFRKVLCPADLMIKNGLWEGKVIIENPPKTKWLTSWPRKFMMLSRKSASKLLIKRPPATPKSSGLNFNKIPLNSAEPLLKDNLGQHKRNQADHN